MPQGLACDPPALGDSSLGGISDPWSPNTPLARFQSIAQKQRGFRLNWSYVSYYVPEGRFGFVLGASLKTCVYPLRGGIGSFQRTEIVSLLCAEQGRFGLAEAVVFTSDLVGRTCYAPTLVGGPQGLAWLTPEGRHWACSGAGQGDLLSGV